MPAVNVIKAKKANVSKVNNDDASDKLKLGKFIEWVEGKGYTVHDIVDGENIGWRDVVIPIRSNKTFEECLKDIWKFYMIRLNENDILDYTPLLNEFKTLISGKVRSICVMSFDKINTSDAGYIETLEFSTADLRCALGEPMKTGKDGDKHRYEWVIEVGKKRVYTIYDWILQDGKFEPFEEAEWFIASVTDGHGHEEEAEDIKSIKEFIDENLKLSKEYYKNNKRADFNDTAEEDILRSVLDDFESIKLDL